MHQEYFHTDGSLRDAADIARDLHIAGYHCAETVVRALWPRMLPNEELTDTTLRMTMVLHGGMGDSMGSHCGALTAGMLMIGALYGRTDLNGDARLAPAIARRYWQRFLDEWGTSHCTTLRSNPELTGDAPTRCGCLIVRSVRILQDVLRELEENPVPLEEMYLWRLDRSKEPCHEQIPVMKSSEEVKAEQQAKSTNQ